MGEDTTEVLLDDVDGDSRQWAALRSLQMANTESMRALEAYLACAYEDASESGPEERLAFLQRAKQRHESVIEHLEFAKAAMADQSD